MSITRAKKELEASESRLQNTVTALRQEVIKHKQTEKALRHRDSVLQAISFAAEQFLKAVNWEQGIDRVLERLGQAMDVSRAYIFRYEVNSEGSFIDGQSHEWSAPGIAPQMSNPRLKRLSYRSTEATAVKQKLSEGECVQGHARVFADELRKHLEAQEIRSVLLVPIFVEEEWWGYFGFDNCSSEREWSVSETNAIKAASGVFGAAIMRQRAEEREKQMRAALYTSAMEWRLTFDAIEYPIIILDGQSRVVRLNRAARELMGKSFQEIIGQPLDEIAIDPFWRRAGDYIRLRGEGSAAPCQVKDESSGRVWNFAVSQFSEGQSGGVWTVLTAPDVTGMVQLQEQLRRSETLSAIGTMVAGVAHEVRNPLFSISATLDAFEAVFEVQEEVLPLFATLRHEIDRLSRLTGELLEYGKPLDLDLSEQPIEELLRSAASSCALLRAQSRVRVSVCVEPGLSPVLMDHGRLRQVFQNLIENAIQHSPSGTPVIIEAREVSESNGGWIECVLKDCGAGFALDVLPKVFEPFFTKRRGGTGLGLAIARRIVEAHQGEIRAGNRPEGGAIMTVRLPVA